MSLAQSGYTEPATRPRKLHSSLVPLTRLVECSKLWVCREGRNENSPSAPLVDCATRPKWPGSPLTTGRKDFVSMCKSLQLFALAQSSQLVTYSFTATN